MFKVKFNTDLELVYGLCYSVAREFNLSAPDIRETLKNYSNDFYNLYLKYASNELKELLKNRTFGFSTLTDIAYSLRTSDDNISTLIKEFEKCSNFNSFIIEHTTLYNEIIDKYKEALLKYSNGLDPYKIYCDFYKQQLDIDINLHTFAAGNNGESFNNKIVLDITLMPCNEDNIEFFRQVIKLIFHEGSHPFVNPLGFEYSKNHDIEPIFIEAKEHGLMDPPYSKAEFIINEYAVRGVELYLTGLVNPEYKQSLLNNADKIGFPRLATFVDKMALMTNYDTFEEFFNKEIVLIYDEIIKELKNKKKSEL